MDDPPSALAEREAEGDQAEVVLFPRQAGQDGDRADFPGEQSGAGHAVGDFGLVYVVAHEYAHNIQQELGIADVNPRYGVEPLELHADCMAGLWGNSVYKEGLLQPGDVEEAISTAQAAGDFEYGNPQHDGTPPQRRAAWLLGSAPAIPPAARTPRRVEARWVRHRTASFCRARSTAAGRWVGRA